MNKRILAIILCMLMIFTSCKKQNSANDTNINIDSNAPANEAQSFQLNALDSNNQGIDVSSTFQLSSNKSIDKSFIEDNLQIIPKIDYEIKKISSTIYNLVPSSSLENNKIYQMMLNNVDSTHSWAFQTQKKFCIENTIPSNKSTYVQVNSGIELYFSMADLEPIDKFFSITPHVDGKFIYNNKSIVFVPNNGLTGGKTYTVTIKKGFGPKDSNEKLSEDYTFNFSIAENYSEIPYISDKLVNIYESNAKLIKGYIGDDYKLNEFKIDIYRFDSSSSFKNSLKTYYETGELSHKLDGYTALSKINSVQQRPYIYNSEYSYRNQGVFELPSDLNKGYYLLNVIIEDKNYSFYQFLQINDLMVYDAVFLEETLFYAIDCKNSQGVQNAEVYVNDNKIGTTNKDGVLVSDYDLEQLKENIMTFSIKADGYNDFIYTRDMYYSWYDKDYYNRIKYNTYMYTDRNVYSPNDTINIWGYATNIDGTRLDNVKLELVEESTNLVLESKFVDLTDIGTFQAKFAINNYTSNYGRINIYHNNTLISSVYFDIKEYSKPLYLISGEFDKAFVYSGEPLKLKLNAKLFDGNPAKGFNIKYGNEYGIYYGGNSNYKVATLDENGEAILDIDTNYESSNWRPQNVAIYSSNHTAEEATIRNYNTYTVFPKRQMLEIEVDKDNSEKFNILLHQLDNSLYDTEQYVDYASLRGKSIDGKINIQIKESYYEKYVADEQYDFINKVNVVNYKYRLIENVVYEEVVETKDGISTITIPNYNSDRYYRVVATYDDGKGRIVEEGSVGYYNYPYYREHYSLNNTNKKDKYRLKDKIGFSLSYNNLEVENIENDKLLILYMNKGLIDYKVFDDTSFTDIFSENCIPSVVFTGVYIKNGYLYPIESYNYLLYDITEKQIYFDAATDKEQYRPGEEVSFNIRAYDENNKPVVADVNISVVDEAYFALFPQSVYTLSSVYMYNHYYTFLLDSYLSNREIKFEDGGAEKGGGGGGFDDTLREEFKDTNVFETVRTNKEGKASVKFKLADNLTSWRITYQGISDKKYAGSGTKNISVTLPFYLDMIMYNKYLVEDNICVTLRAFGQEAVEGEKVSYKVVVKNKGTNKQEEFIKDGIIGKYTNITIGKREKGEYELYVYASSNTLKDAIKEEFEVVESFVYFNNTNKYELTNDTVLDEVYSNPVITLYNNSKSDFFNALRKLTIANGKRIDQSISSFIAVKYINSYFGLDVYYNENDLINILNEYMNSDGGYKLLPYSDADTELTSKLVYVVDNDLVNERAKKHFNYILSDNIYDTKIAASIWGLAKYREPVLLEAYGLLKNNDMLLRDRIYLCLALAELGDYNTARQHYSKMISENIKNSGEYLYFENNVDSTDNYELTALMAILGVMLKDYENSDKLFGYIYNNPSSYTLSNFEQLIYIKHRDILSIDEVKDLFGEVTVAVNNQKQTYKIKLFDEISISVKKEDVKNIRFTNIKGDIECVVNALGNKDDMIKNKSEDFSMSVNYTSENSTVQQNTFKQSDTIKVTIMPSIISDVERGFYEITYVLPSGFRFIKNDTNNRAWFREDGQKLIYQVRYNRQSILFSPIIFYMQATQNGEYTVDYAVMKDYFGTKLNYIEKYKLNIE